MISAATVLVMFQIFVIIVVGLWHVFGAGRKEGKKEGNSKTSNSTLETAIQHLREDLDELRQGVVINNQAREREFKELERFVNRIEAAFVSHTGKTINGIDYRTEEH